MYDVENSTKHNKGTTNDVANSTQIDTNDTFLVNNSSQHEKMQHNQQGVIQDESNKKISLL